MLTARHQLFGPRCRAISHQAIDHQLWWHFGCNRTAQSCFRWPFSRLFRLFGYRCHLIVSYDQWLHRANVRPEPPNFRPICRETARRRESISKQIPSSAKSITILHWSKIEIPVSSIPSRRSNEQFWFWADSESQQIFEWFDVVRALSRSRVFGHRMISRCSSQGPELESARNTCTREQKPTDLLLSASLATFRIQRRKNVAAGACVSYEVISNKWP